MTQQPRKRGGQRTPTTAQVGHSGLAEPVKEPRWQIESPTRGIYVGSDYAHRATNWPTFMHAPSSEASIIRFDDKQAAEAELARVRSYAANARLREVG